MSATTDGTTRRVPVGGAANGPLWGGLAVLVLLVLAGLGGFGREFPEIVRIDLVGWVDAVDDWAVANRQEHWLFVSVLGPIARAVALGLAEINGWLDWLGWPGVMIFVAVIAHLAAGWRIAIVTVAALAAIGMIGQWEAAMFTLAQMTVAVAASVAIGVPIGVLAGRVEAVQRVVRPVLDAMQTTPAYVYLVPLIVLFGIGQAPAIIATMIYAIPPVVRLTALGIRTVPSESLEVGTSLGTTGPQLLRTIQLPQAMPSIRVGINQTIMMALAMVVIVALIGGGGLGNEVFSGLRTVDVPAAAVPGVAIVLIAVVLDRITFGAGAIRGRRLPRWAWPAGLLGGLALGLLLGRLPGAATFPFPEAIPLAEWIGVVNDYVQQEWRSATRAFSDFVLIWGLNPLRDDLLLWLPWWAITGLSALAAWRTVGGGLALYAVVAWTIVGAIGLWEPAVDTASQVALATALTVALGLPLGIAGGLWDKAQTALRPVLDTMQTLPAFVYLVPVVVLFQVGRVPGIIASVIYAMPPIVRLTSAGIRQVPEETLEAARATGATRWQLLRTVQLPLAKRSILMGVNQTTMMVLATVIIAGLIGAGALGIEAVDGLTRREVGGGIAAGLAIVLLGILVDRITQALGGGGQEAERQRATMKTA
ncbi:ABC transporter permease subunit [Egibacter rhizosphaerae]|uniref:ABC transporter permease subunit n=1 Tax=Egibacter rhizosphaerae TaxID=1670831 RepID=A0A411YDM9_9ACTN|nr:ABC transporter permease subunit [Egibacter rhizosphaerae]QBI19311.1 ABC transporter permease subunit [Egibacter rhizosphaerae]